MAVDRVDRGSVHANPCCIIGPVTMKRMSGPGITSMGGTRLISAGDVAPGSDRARGEWRPGVCCSSSSFGMGLRRPLREVPLRDGQELIEKSSIVPTNLFTWLVTSL